ncbi:MAG: type III-B CRISPR-associated protein Cas10/Cmr2 [Ruminococcus sp.]
MEKNKYIAVTIGPIFDTVNLASSLSALWAASYMFSMLSKNICIELTKNGIKEEEIISPFYSSTNPELNKNDGVGLFHDRIIFRADNFKIKSFGAVKKNAIRKTVQMFGFNDEELKYFNRYFLVSAFEYYSDNPVIDSSKALDSLELSKPFAEEKNKNPLLTLFTSDNTERKNEKIIKQINNLGITDWQLFKDNKKGVCTIEDLASRNIPEKLKKQYKKYKYYAIVRSDGDRMGSIISSLKNDGEIHSFSKNCLDYCSKISELVHKDYDGITIYSGGDDLLALLPVENGDCKTIFDFVKDANKVFKKSFEEYKGAGASLSFGIFVSYVKYPLYEALEQSAKLLFGVAKERKNAVAVHFQKHAGQSEGLLISNDSLESFIRLHKKITEGKAENKSEILLSSMHKLTLFSDIFNSAENSKEIQNVFKNTFDADAHIGNNFLSAVLPEFFSGLKTKSINIYPITDDGVAFNKNDCVLTMTYVLRIIKFFTESAGET